MSHSHDRRHAAFDDLGDEGFQEGDDEQVVDEIKLTTVGIDIGSATTHFLLSRITMRRLGVALMSRYEVVDRREIFRSDVLLTPYRSSTEIDSARLNEFFAESFQRCGVAHEDIDTGVVMLTGEAARKSNARPIAELFAHEMGRFVCTSAGHHLEARMAANGSGAAAQSRENETDIVNVDIGGGTTKFALLSEGEVLGTAALNVGGRLVALNNGVVTRIDAAAARVARELDVQLTLGEPLPDGPMRDIAARLADCVVEYLTTKPPYSTLTEDLLLTPPLDGICRVRDIVMSGGVSEYVVATDAVTVDLGRLLAEEFVHRGREAGLTINPATERIRATVVGLSQFTTQLSGDTVYTSSPNAVPLTNLPVVNVDLRDLADDPSPEQVAAAIAEAMRTSGRDALLDPVALTLEWDGKPYFRNLSALASGLASAAEHVLPPGPLVVVLSQDCARSLGRVLGDVLGGARNVVCIDGLHLQEHDFIDVGGLIQQDSVLPVVVKTLVFPNSSGKSAGGDGSTGQYSEAGGRIL